MCRKVAITVDARHGLGSRVDPRFDRAACVIVVDSQDGNVVAEVGNLGSEQSPGALVTAAKQMVKLKVSAVLSGCFGPAAVAALEALGIELWIAPSGLTAGNALSLFYAGQLSRP
jgi:predicted Fe-Mo cluster-binding NifX family protein